MAPASISACSSTSVATPAEQPVQVRRPRELPLVEARVERLAQRREPVQPEMLRLPLLRSSSSEAGASPCPAAASARRWP